MEEDSEVVVVEDSAEEDSVVVGVDSEEEDSAEAEEEDSVEEDSVVAVQSSEAAGELPGGPGGRGRDVQGQPELKIEWEDRASGEEKRVRLEK